MGIEKELALEEKFIQKLVNDNGYKRLYLNDVEKELPKNLRGRLGDLNGTCFSEREFKDILYYLEKGDIFEKANTLRGQYQLRRDDESTKNIRFIDTDNWCDNAFQVANQLTQRGQSGQHRYDVTIFINGLPLVQVELKRRNVDIKNAFEQIGTYQKTSYGEGLELFQYIQIFVISNSISTRYFANNANLTFNQTFTWATAKNDPINELPQFTDTFLEKCHLAEMICRYTVLSKPQNLSFVMRPYQVYAVKAILNLIERASPRVDATKENTNNGYIWHATGSGKTLTSFKAAQIISMDRAVDKVVFVVDRRDLDHQTMEEFNSFSEGSISGTSTTEELIRHLKSNDRKPIVTTIQKLAKAVKRMRVLETSDGIERQRFVFIFDECHRSQFGEMNLDIKKFFTKNQMIGFTGTPIFNANAGKISDKVRSRLSNADDLVFTTDLIFNKCMHSYTTMDAIEDNNVLPFAVEYVGKKEPKERKNHLNISGEMESTPETKEELEHPDRIDAIARYIVENHDRKTDMKIFNAIFATPSINTLKQYYKKFKEMKEAGEHDLKIAAIFSYSSPTPKIEEPQPNSNNDDDSLEEGIGAEVDRQHIDKTLKEQIESIMEDYNAMFKTSFSTNAYQGYENYYRDISSKVKKNELDILIVVDMFLTGFDSKGLGVLYVDKNLKFHGLIQAFSRTNRLSGAKEANSGRQLPLGSSAVKPKSHGNIVTFRNIKDKVDEAVLLFSNERNARSSSSKVMVVSTFRDVLRKFHESLEELYRITPTPEDARNLSSDKEKVDFIRASKEVIEAYNTIKSYSEFEEDKDIIRFSAEDIDEIAGVHIDISNEAKERAETRKADEEPTELEVISFALEALHNDNINVEYILGLLKNLHKQEGKKEKASEQAVTDIKQQVERLIMSSPELRKKSSLIRDFMAQELPKLSIEDNIKGHFDTFAATQGLAALKEIAAVNNLDYPKLSHMIRVYRFSQELPRRKQIRDAITKENLTFIERKRITDQVQKSINDYIGIYE